MGVARDITVSPIRSCARSFYQTLPFTVTLDLGLLDAMSSCTDAYDKSKEKFTGSLLVLALALL